jgi:gliding motility-associated-like protein
MNKALIFLFIFFSINVFSQTTDWVKACGGPNSDKGISIGTDSLGFIYISGFFNGDADFGPFHLTASYSTNKNMFLAKMDSLGNFLWAVAGTGGPYDDRALGMHVTPGGDVFLTGTFWGYIEFPSASGPVSLGGNGCDTSVLIKIDSDGNCVFVIQVCNGTGSGSCPWPIYDCDDHSYDVKTDDDGFIYITGFYSTFSADFGGGTVTLNNPNWADCQPAGYIGKWDSLGNLIWVEGFDGIKDQRGSRDNRLALDKFSNIYVVGGFQDTGIYGPFSLTSNGEWDIFIFKMDKDGNWLWAKNVGSNKTDRANSIAIDVCDDIYITGEYRNAMVFPGANASNGTDTLSHKKKRDIFVAKMNNQGDWKWAKRARSSGTDKPYQMSVDANKQVFLCGTAGGETTFSTGLVVDAQILGDTTMSSWVAQIDGASNNGDWVWAKMAGSNTDDDDRTNDICPDGFGNVYAIGFFEDVANFDGTAFTSLGQKDIFVWKMSITPGSFTYNNTSETILRDSMVFNPADTGIFTTQSYYIDGCDTLFTDSVVHQRLGVRVVYTLNDLSTTSTITVDGTVLIAFPFSMDYYLNAPVAISSTIDPLYGFTSWSSNSVTISPSNISPNASFNVTSSDTVRLNIYKKPTIIYDVSPSGTTTTIDINGINTSIFPTSAIYYNNETITLTPNIDPLYSFVSWDYDSITMINGNTEVNSFVSAYNDTVKLVISLIPPLAAFIAGDEVVCDNSLAQADVEVSFVSGILPYTFIYAINGVTQSSITTYDNPYHIKTKQEGVYTLTYFSDANSSGSINGSAIVTVLESPTALFATASDTLSVLYPSVQLNDVSIGSIVAWTWDFGDNTPNDYTSSPYHVFKDSIGIYQLSLMVTDNFGCSDTTFKQLWVADDYWMYIPNSFTPDNDGINDLFCLTHHGIREATFHFNVYDRFSNLVYATENIADLECFLNANGWDGKHYSTGNDLPMGTYVYEVYFQDFEGWKHQDRGHIFIIR